MAGIEPATDGLRNRCSPAELHWPDHSERAVASPTNSNFNWRTHQELNLKPSDP